jgi:twitching motility protein PilT
LMALSMMSIRQKEKFTEGAELDIAYGPSGIGRFRVCVFHQQGSVGMETIQRIITVFPTYEQRVVRLQLASALHAVVSQRLVPRADGLGRVSAVEVMVATAFIRDCRVSPDKTRLIPSAIAGGTSEYGMQTFDQSVYGLYSRGLITGDEALLHASIPDNLRLRMQGVRSASDAANDEMTSTLERASSD